MRILSATSVRDEGPFLLEWIAWHRMLGVTDFLIASNDCRDGTDALLQALAVAGVVVHLPQVPDPDKSVQWQALKAAWKHPLRKAADWMLISDVDEFPLIHAGQGRLADLIAALPSGTDAVALPWRLFGHGGVAGFRDQPVTAQFQHCAPARMLHPIAATFFKSLFRPAAFRQPGVHRPARRADHVPLMVDGSGRPLPPVVAGNDGRLSLIGIDGGRQLAELHHYSLRSAESFVVKSDRGLPNRTDKRIDLRYWVERNFNAEHNAAALTHAPALAAEIAALKALPGVAALHEAACDWHRAAFARAFATPAGYQLYADCLQAGSSAVLPDPLAMALLRGWQALTAPQD